MSKHIYVSQSGAGAQTGVDALNAYNRAWINNSGNWGVGAAKVNAGDTVHIVGANWDDDLGIFGDGVAGSPITIKFETNMSLPAKTPIYMPNRSWIIFDLNGHYLECNDNGTDLGHQLGVGGIEASGCSHIDFCSTSGRGQIRKMYQHTSAADNALGPANAGVAGIYMNGAPNGDIKIHGIDFSDVPWAISIRGNNAATSIGFYVYDCTFTRTDHGVAGFGNCSNVYIHDCDFGATASWDTTANVWHHDGIHIFFGGSSDVLNNLVIYNNLFHGDWGVNNTAHIYIEGDPSHVALDAINGMLIYNNVFLAQSRMSNGMLCSVGGLNCRYFNNTFDGGGITNQIGVQISRSADIRNNVIIGCKTFMNLTPMSQAQTLDYNVYGNPAGTAQWLINSASGTPYTMFAAWKTASGEGSHSQNVALSLLNSNGTPQAGSPVIGLGVALNAIFTTDKNGVTRGGTWDIGAYAYSSTPTPPVPSTVKANTRYKAIFECYVCGAKFDHTH